MTQANNMVRYISLSHSLWLDIQKGARLSYCLVTLNIVWKMDNIKEITNSDREATFLLYYVGTLQERGQLGTTIETSIEKTTNPENIS